MASRWRQRVDSRDAEEDPVWVTVFREGEPVARVAVWGESESDPAGGTIVVSVRHQAAVSLHIAGVVEELGEVVR